MKHSNISSCRSLRIEYFVEWQHGGFLERVDLYGKKNLQNKDFLHLYYGKYCKVSTYEDSKINGKMPSNLS